MKIKKILNRICVPFRKTPLCAVFVFLSVALLSGCKDDNEGYPPPPPITNFTVTFNTGTFSSVVNPQTIKKGLTLKKPNDPTKKRKNFVGWYSDAELKNEFKFTHLITRDMTLYARWADIIHIIKFDSQGGSTVDELKMAEGEAAKEPEKPTKSGSFFEGWFTDAAGTKPYNFDDLVLKEIKLYAKWVPAFTVTLKANNGEPDKQITVKQGEAIAENEIPKAGKKRNLVFNAWCSDSALANEFDFANTKITEDITLYARWKAVITLKGVGGRPDTKKSYIEGELVRSLTPDQVFSDLQDSGKPIGFINWFADSDFNTPFDFTKPVEKSVTIYQLWVYRILDPVFKARLKTQHPEIFTARNFVNISKAESVTDISIAGDPSGGGDRITNLDGIQYFTKLKKLDCSSNSLNSLDISKNTDLEYLDCSSNDLSKLDVTKNKFLKHLNTSSNPKITSLEVTHNTDLEYLNNKYNNLTSTLDISHNTHLKVLYCMRNGLTDIDISNSLELKRLDCSQNELTRIDLSNNKNLISFYCDTNKLTTLDIRTIKNPGKYSSYQIIGGYPDYFNRLTELKVNDALKDHTAVKRVKDHFGSIVKIKVYDNDGNEINSDYTPR